MTEMTFNLHAPEGAPLTLELKDSYELIHVDYRDALEPGQVAAIVRGDFEELWDSVAHQFESEARFHGAKYVADELLAEHDIEPDEFDGYGELIDAISERDNSDFIGELAAHTPAVLLRINVIDEDHGYSFEPVEPERVLADVGLPLPATKANVETVAEMLANCSPEYSVLMGYWVVGADVADLYKMPSDPDGEVEIVNPYLYLGNPFAGSGFITERPLQGVVRVKRGELRTDKDAFGYSLDEVYGGLTPSSFSAELKSVPTKPEEAI